MGVGAEDEEKNGLKTLVFLSQCCLAFLLKFRL